MSSRDSHWVESSAQDRLAAAVDGVGIDPVFQPIVELPSGAVVGFEALARWPSLDDPAPEAVFEHAAAHGGLDGLDRSCISAAVDLALGSDLALGTMLLVNCEPTSTYVGPDDDDVLARGREHLRVTFELTERSLLAHPRGLLRKLAEIRADGFSIALDDVGAHPDSLALLDVVCPDIIKLDLTVVQSDPSHDQARTLSAVLAHHERNGAVILAEGIENEEHLEQAMAVGATLGQGFMFGRAGAISGDGGGDTVSWPIASDCNFVGVDSRSPFELVTDCRPARTVRTNTLLALSRHIETQARHAADPPMLMAGLQQATFFTPPTRARYQALAARLPLVAVFGEDLPDDLGAVRGVPLDPSDPLCRQWTVVMVGPHSAAALTAREHDLDGDVSGADRRFDLAMTHDRALVTRCARSLLDRMW